MDAIFGDSAGVADGTTGIGSFADLVGNPHAVPASDPTVKGHLLFNPAAYSQAQGLTFGNTGRSSLNNPYRTNVDMSVYKVFKTKEKIQVQFRAEAFNVFNQWEGTERGFQRTDKSQPATAKAPAHDRIAFA